MEKTINLIALKILIFTFLAARTNGQNETLCNPIDNCEDVAVTGIKVPDPSDCHNYFLCIEGLDEDGNTVIKPTDQPLVCDVGDYFQVDEHDQSFSDCQKEDIPCINICANRHCLAYCYEDLDLLAVPKNCNQYYFCIPDADPVVIACSVDAPYFNGLECTDNPFECCDICTPYCSKAFTEVPDPNDCRGYYLCTENDSVPTESFKCQTNEYFNPLTGFCEEIGSEGCKSLC